MGSMTVYKFDGNYILSRSTDSSANLGIALAGALSLSTLTHTSH